MQCDVPYKYRATILMESGKISAENDNYNEMQGIAHWGLIIVRLLGENYGRDKVKTISSLQGGSRIIQAR